MARSVEEMEHVVETLAARISELEIAVATSRGDRVSLKEDTRCPKCGHTTVLHNDKVIADPSHGEKYSKPLSAAVKSGWVSVKSLGTFEIYVCEGCGLTEWYVTDPKSARDSMLVIEGPEPDASGPYR